MPSAANGHAIVLCPNKHTFQVEIVKEEAPGTEYFDCPLCGIKFNCQMPHVVR